MVRPAAGGRAGQEDSRHRRFAPTGVGPVTPSARADPRPGRRSRRPPDRPATLGRQSGKTREIASADDYRRMAMALLFGAAFDAASAWRSAPENARPSPLIYPAVDCLPAIAASRRWPSAGRPHPKSPPVPTRSTDRQKGPAVPASPGRCSPPRRLVTCPGRLPDGLRRNSTERSADHVKRRNNYF